MSLRPIKVSPLFVEKRLWGPTMKGEGHDYNHTGLPLVSNNIPQFTFDISSGNLLT